MDGVYEPKDKNSSTGVIIFLIGFFLLGMAALMSFLISNRTIDYKIENKTYTVMGKAKELESLIGEKELQKVIIIGTNNFQEVPNTFDGKSLIIKADNKHLLLEFSDKTLIKISNNLNSKRYYSTSSTDNIYDYSNDSLKSKSKEPLVNDKEESTLSATEIAEKSKTLGSGNHTVGKDISSGTYNLHALSGNGNLYIKNESGRLKYNELVGVGNEYADKKNIYSKDLKDVILENGYIITISDNMKIKFTATK